MTDAERLFEEYAHAFWALVDAPDDTEAMAAKASISAQVGPVATTRFVLSIVTEILEHPDSPQPGCSGREEGRALG